MTEFALTICEDCSWPNAEQCCCPDADIDTGLCEMHTEARRIVDEMEAITDD